MLFQADGGAWRTDSCSGGGGDGSGGGGCASCQCFVVVASWSNSQVIEVGHLDLVGSTGALWSPAALSGHRWPFMVLSLFQLVFGPRLPLVSHSNSTPKPAGGRKDLCCGGWICCTVQELTARGAVESTVGHHHIHLHPRRTCLPLLSFTGVVSTSHPPPAPHAPGSGRFHHGQPQVQDAGCSRIVQRCADYDGHPSAVVG